MLLTGPGKTKMAVNNGSMRSRRAGSQRGPPSRPAPTRPPPNFAPPAIPGTEPAHTGQTYTYFICLYSTHRPVIQDLICLHSTQARNSIQKSLLLV